MGRKMKGIIFLIIMLVMIYCQHSTTYAEKKEMLQTGYETHGKDNTEEQGVTEKPGGGEEPDSGGEPDGGEESDSGDGNEDGKDEEEKEPLQKYRLEFPEPDGRNGYFKTVPEIKISHVDKRGSTWYSLTVNGAVKAGGTLHSAAASAVLGEGQLEEGKNILTIYMEEEDGTRQEEYDCAETFLLDLTAPQFDMKASNGFDAWYQKEAWIDVTAEDGANGSQIDSISCYCGNQIIGTVRKPQAEFLINQASDKGRGVNITVTVTDQAGHKTENTRRLYIDNAAPQTEIMGIEDYMITSQAVEAVFQAREDNGIKETAAQVEWESAEGDRQTVPVGTWKEENGVREAALTLSEDGIYRMKMRAVDLAGHTSEKEAQVIIDSHNPVIRYVDELDGQFMKKFCWNYSKEEFIEDFTTFVHQIQLDGVLYPAGRESVEEGRHVLRVEAVDSAGNKAEARAGFVIDHTPPEILFIDVEEDGIYEEEKTFKIALKNPEDQIQEIRINGIPQPVGKGKTAFQYTVQEIADYEVDVKARDKAGNYVSSGIAFEVSPKETIFEKAAKPVKRLFGISQEDGRQEYDARTKAEKRKGNYFFPAVFIFLAACGSAAGITVWRRSR